MQLANIHITGFSPISHHFSLFDFTTYSYFFSNNALFYSGLFSGNNIIIDEEEECIYSNGLFGMFFRKVVDTFISAFPPNMWQAKWEYTRFALLYGDKKRRDYLIQVLLRSPGWIEYYNSLKTLLSSRVSRECADSSYDQFDIYPIVIADCSLGLCLLNFEPQQDYFCIRGASPGFFTFHHNLFLWTPMTEKYVMRIFSTCILLPIRYGSNSGNP